MAGLIRDVSDEQFEDQVLNAAGIVLVDFWAPWCGPCKAIAPFLDRIAKEFDGELEIVKVNVDTNPIYSGRLGVRSVPTLILFRKGEIVKEMSGAPDPKQLVDLLEETLQAGQPEE